MNPHPKMIWKFYLNNSKDLLKQPLSILYTATTKAKQNSQEINSITKNNIIILNGQEVQLNNITLISRKDYTNKKPKEYNLTTKTYNIVLDHQPQGTRENIKNNVDLNSAAILITVKCFHSLILTIYNPTLRAITAKKHSSTAQKS